MVVQIHVFLGYPLRPHALFIAPPRGHVLSTQGIAPHEVAEPCVLDFAHLGRKEVELEYTCLDEPLDLRFGYRCNIMKAGTGKRRNLPTLDHASVADERHPFAVKAPGYLRNLRRQGL